MMPVASGSRGRLSLRRLVRSLFHPAPVLHPRRGAQGSGSVGGRCKQDELSDAHPIVHGVPRGSTPPTKGESGVGSLLDTSLRMKRSKKETRITFGAASFVVAAIGCVDSTGGSSGEVEGSRIAEETADLKEAVENRDGRDVDELKTSVEETKEKLASLREQLARAHEGLSDEIMKERRELQAAMRQQMEQVKRKLAEAENAARRYNRLNDEAIELLAETAPPNVKAEVEVRLRELPSRVNIDSTTRVEEIEYETNQLQPKADETPPEDRAAKASEGRSESEDGASTP